MSLLIRQYRGDTMTVENCIKLLKMYKDNMNNEELSSAAREQSRKNYEMMKTHILNPKSRKFSGHAIQRELSGGKVDGKKSKG